MMIGWLYEYEFVLGVAISYFAKIGCFDELCKFVMVCILSLPPPKKQFLPSTCAK
ncbi:hypothetical protein [Moraxella lacunata]|uniref:hypothetical protein n=1 Tax=Moraxella lacunata TaxID=477 RepID=UPI003EE15901